jgi:uncharacterized protein YndB with AHSA1/START domain
MTPDTGPSAGGAFTVRRRLPAPAERVYAAFVEPGKLAQWFVVDGYHTPADRIRVNATAGGRMEAVMVSDADGSEIPFGFEYADVDPPRRVVLRFDEPPERVTVTLSDAGAGGVDLVYDFVSRYRPADEEAARRGVEDMLDLIELGIARNTI